MDCSEVAAISSQTERIEMEEGGDQNNKNMGVGYNAVIESSGVPNDEKVGGTPCSHFKWLGTTYAKHGLCSGIWYL